MRLIVLLFETFTVVRFSGNITINVCKFSIKNFKTHSYGCQNRIFLQLVPMLSKTVFRGYQIALLSCKPAAACLVMCGIKKCLMITYCEKNTVIPA